MWVRVGPNFSAPRSNFRMLLLLHQLAPWTLLSHTFVCFAVPQILSSRGAKLGEKLEGVEDERASWQKTSYPMQTIPVTDVLFLWDKLNRNCLRFSHHGKKETIRFWVEYRGFKDLFPALGKQTGNMLGGLPQCMPTVKYVWEIVQAAFAIGDGINFLRLAHYSWAQPISILDAWVSCASPRKRPCI